MAQLFLDCDGVLADFDTGAREIFGGMTPAQFEARYSRREFWRRLAGAPDFYNSLPLMDDAQDLFDAVAHLYPTILTGLPLGTWAAPQSRFPDYVPAGSTPAAGQFAGPRPTVVQVTRS